MPLKESIWCHSGLFVLELSSYNCKPSTQEPGLGLPWVSRPHSECQASLSCSIRPSQWKFSSILSSELLVFLLGPRATTCTSLYSSFFSKVTSWKTGSRKSVKGKRCLPTTKRHSCAACLQLRKVTLRSLFCFTQWVRCSLVLAIFSTLRSLFFIRTTAWGLGDSSEDKVLTAQT